MALSESIDDGHELRDDRPPDYRSGDFSVRDPGSNREQQDIGPLMSGHTALTEAFDGWVQGLYPEARCVGDVADILAGKLTILPPVEPHTFIPPSGSVPVKPTTITGEL
jgi:hypothetical protein